jgi:hypothetical protein
MQPFGLFNLLKSALFSELDSSLKATDETTKIPPQQPSTEQKTDENPPIETLQTTENNAYLAFLTRHEQRAGRQKKR